MQLHFNTSPLSEVVADWLLIPLTEAADLPADVQQLDAALGGAITRLRESGDFTGKPGQTVPLHALAGVSPRRLMLVGLGPSDKLDAERLRRSLATAARGVSESKPGHIACCLPAQGTPPLEQLSMAQLVTTALVVGCVGPDLYKAERSRHPFSEITLLVASDSDNQAVRDACQRGFVLGEAVNLSRELVNRPASDVYPETFADRARQLATEVGLQCDVLDEPRLQQERMGSLLAVAQGSDRPPRVVVLEHLRGGPEQPVIALVGKGVTFDSGGLSLKPNDSMKTMKADMAGAATVLGVMAAVARLELPVNVVGFMGLVENMPSGKAYKLGDILTARNGVTIEVLNTDAEGRLVLADVLSYAVDRGASRLVDLATLTGACVVALGEEVVGAFTNNEDWCTEVLAAAGRVGEPIWELPMFDSYDSQLKSDVSDVKNVGTRWGGAITAAKFLQRFVGETPWVHLDIAGPAFSESSKDHQDSGATGVMVQTLVDLLSRV